MQLLSTKYCRWIVKKKKEFGKKLIVLLKRIKQINALSNLCIDAFHF